jgi:hypothetical protein
MNTYELAAFGTGPLFLFVSNEKFYAGLLYVHKIVDHAHSILGPVARIQVIQPVAGKAVTVEAVPDFTSNYLLTGLNPAQNAGLRFETVVTPASGACIPVSPIGPTESAVHSAGGDQRGAHCIFLCQFSRRHAALLKLRRNFSKLISNTTPSKTSSPIPHRTPLRDAA